MKGFAKFFGIGVTLAVAPPLGVALLIWALAVPRESGEVSPVRSRRGRGMRGADPTPETAPLPPPGVWMNPEAYLPGSAFLHPEVDASNSSE